MRAYLHACVAALHGLVASLLACVFGVVFVVGVAVEWANVATSESI